MSDKPQVGLYDLFMLGLCIYVLTALAATTFFPLDPSVVEILNYVDVGICVVFLLDFSVRLAMAKNRLRYLKWGWIDFISSIPMVGPLRWGRFARVFRILRLLRGVRSGKMLGAYILKHRAESAFTATALITLLVIVFSSIAVLHFERGADTPIQEADDALWWAFVTVTTVGYGDMYPVTVGGRVVAGFAMLAGVGLFGTFTGFLASWFLSPQEEEQEDELELIRDRLARIEAQLTTLIERRK